MYGSAPVRALFFEFPDEPELFGIDEQFLIGRDILVTPVLTPNATTVSAIFPGRGTVSWRDWYTHARVPDAPTDGRPFNATLAAPLGHINVHVRDGAALLLHARPGYTTAETRAGPYALLVSADAHGRAAGSAYVDDGETMPPTPNATLAFAAAPGELRLTARGDYQVRSRLETVTVLGAGRAAPASVRVDGREVARGDWEFDAGLERLVVSRLSVDLNEGATLTWV